MFPCTLSRRYKNGMCFLSFSGFCLTWRSINQPGLCLCAFLAVSGVSLLNTRWNSSTVLIPLVTGLQWIFCGLCYAFISKFQMFQVRSSHVVIVYRAQFRKWYATDAHTQKNLQCKKFGASLHMAVVGISLGLGYSKRGCNGFPPGALSQLPQSVTNLKLLNQKWSMQTEGLFFVRWNESNQIQH